MSARSARQHKACGGVSPGIVIEIMPQAREAGGSRKGDFHARLLHEPPLPHRLLN